jgi:hybrid cluster-associated redox disulfide protein
MIFEKNATINEIISAYPETIKFFSDLKMSCSSCFAVKFDTLENGALMHGMDVNVLINQLDQYIRSLPPSVISTEK